MVQEQVQP